MNLRSLITEPEVLRVDREDPRLIRVHGEILARKPMLRGVFEEFYQLCVALDRSYFGEAPGNRVELGAGVSLFKSLYPEVLVTDVKWADHLDAVVDAQEMPFRTGSIRALYGLSFFHHLSDPEAFFRETLRVLAPGGGCVLLEPFHGLVASQHYRFLHSFEGYDKTAPDWASRDRAGLAMRDANQALSYIVFERDRERFSRLFPNLEIVYRRPLRSYLRYFFSGGLNYRSLLPSFFIGPLKLLEKALTPTLPVTALYQMIVLRKRAKLLPG